MIPALLFLALATSEPPVAAAPVRVEAAWRGTGDATGSLQPAHVLPDEDVHLGVVIHLEDGSCAVKGGLYRDAGGKDRPCEHELGVVEACRVAWHRVRPARTRIHRTARGVPRDGPAPADPRAMVARLRPDVEMLAAEDEGEAWLGTFRFSAVLECEGAQPLESPPLSVRVRRDDSPAGVLWELSGVPVVDAARGTPDTQHETALHEGMDAATAVVHALRRTGADVPLLHPAWAPSRWVRVSGTPRPGDAWVDGTRVAILDRLSGREAWVVEVTDAGVQEARVNPQRGAFFRPARMATPAAPRPSRR